MPGGTTAPLPSFETARLRIRPRHESDLEACLAMDRDPEVTKFIPVPWNDPEAHRAFVLERLRTAYPVGFGYWSLFAREQSEDFLGWVLLLPYHAVGKEVEIGWRLRRACWGRGYAVEASRPILLHAFETLGLETLVADIHADNSASIRVAEKLGFRFSEDRHLKDVPAKSYQLHAPSKER